MEGWVKLHRELAEKPIWLCSTPQQKTILITILLMANHEEKEWEWQGEKFICKAGQFVTSLDKIAEKCGLGVTQQNVRTALKRFEKFGFLTNKSTKTGRLINVENWGIYQSKDEAPNKASNRQLTNDQQRPNKQLTPNKNDKNDKNDKNKKSIGQKRTVFTPPTIDQVKEYCTERKNNVDAERFIDFYSCKGWMVGKNKMKDWKAAVRTWERSDYNGRNGTSKKSEESDNSKYNGLVL